MCYEYQNRNAREIARRAAGVYDTFAGFVAALEDIGDGLNKALWLTKQHIGAWLMEREIFLQGLRQSVSWES